MRTCQAAPESSFGAPLDPCMLLVSLTQHLVPQLSRTLPRGMLARMQVVCQCASQHREFLT